MTNLQNSPHNCPSESLESIRRILEETRIAVELIVYSNNANSTRTLTDLLAAVPVQVADNLGRNWSEIQKTHSKSQIVQYFRSEELLLLDMVLAMYDDRRSYTVQSALTAETLPGNIRVC
jgi:hypothetical protein